MLFTPNLELRGAGPSELGAGGLSFHQILEDTLKFGLSEKHTKFENIFLMHWTFTIPKFKEDCANFSVLLNRKTTKNEKS